LSTSDFNPPCPPCTRRFRMGGVGLCALQAFHGMVRHARAHARTEATVLIEGETARGRARGEGHSYGGARRAADRSSGSFGAILNR